MSGGKMNYYDVITLRLEAASAIIALVAVMVALLYR